MVDKPKNELLAELDEVLKLLNASENAGGGVIWEAIVRLRTLRDTASSAPAAAPHAVAPPQAAAAPPHVAAPPPLGRK